MRRGLRIAPRFGGVFIEGLGRAEGGADEMNKLEAGYASHLELQRLEGRVLAWRWQPFSMRLAPSLFYRPDFLVQLTDRRLEIHETKGFWRDDARVKIRAAAEMFPMFAFIAISRSQAGGWDIERFSPAVAP